MRLRDLSPFWRSYRALRVAVVTFFTIVLPIYIFVGLQPVSSAAGENYPSLTIDAIGLDTPVASLELNNQELIAPAAIAGIYDQHNGKLFIIGHSSTVFQRLAEVAPGTVITYDSQLYIITEAITVEKSAVDMTKILASTEQETLILMTCAGQSLPGQDATHRFIATAVRVDD